MSISYLENAISNVENMRIELKRKFDHIGDLDAEVIRFLFFYFFLD
jgi:hypothetical protein